MAVQLVDGVVVRSWLKVGGQWYVYTTPHPKIPRNPKVAWKNINFTGSDLSDVETRDYDDLQDRPVIYTDDTVDKWEMVDDDENVGFTLYDQTNWDDMRVGSTGLKAPTTSPASWTQFGSSGIYTWQFGSGDILHFETQLTHRYKRGTDLRAHVHWSPEDTNTGTVNWKMFYQIKNFNDTFSGTTSLDTGTGLYDPGDGTPYKHQITPSYSIDGDPDDVDLRESAVIFGYVERVAGDTYTGDPYLLSIDFHIQTDKPGTELEIPS